MKVYWTDRAKARLHDIQEYIAQDNPSVAREVVAKIIRRSQLLGTPPDIGHSVRGYEALELREILVRPYRVIYHKTATQVNVITVLHYRQLLPKDLKQLDT